MAEEKNINKDNGTKFSSGTAYVQGKTDYASYLRPRNDDDEEIDTTPVVKEAKQEKPEPKKSANREEMFKNLISQAISGKDSDYDELDDSFEKYYSPEEREEHNKKIEEQKSHDNKDNVESQVTSLDSKETKNETANEENNNNIEEQKNPENEIKLEDIKEISPPPEVINKEETLEIQEVEIEQKTELSTSEVVNKNTENTDSQSQEDLFAQLEKIRIEKGETDNIFSGGELQKSDFINFEESGNIKPVFNKNPDKKLIEGHNFNDPYLDSIYNYSYPDEMVVLRLRKAKERQKKLEEQIAQEEKLEKSRKDRAEKAAKRQNNLKPKKPLKVPDKYPKVYEDPTDEEIDEKTGKPYYYFNFTKTIEYSKLKFLGKILPTKAIDEVLYDKGAFDRIAEMQHEKTTRLNNMSAAEQYSRDNRNIAITVFVMAIFIFSIVFKVFFDIMPDRNYEIAMNYLNNKDYENAYYTFNDLGDKELSIYYAKYSEAKMYYKYEKYEEAKEAFTLLLPYQDAVFKNLHINIQDEINECSYQIALTYYYANDYETAKNIFKEIYTYSDSTERYYECGYQIARQIDTNWQDNEDLKKALKYYYRVRNYSKSDVSSSILRIQETLYDNATNFYNQKNYEEALDIYEYLAIFNYTDVTDGVSAKDMVSQCTYRYGLDLYANRQYESARKVLTEIPWYKDSYVLSKECVYNIAKILYNNNPVASIAEFNKIIGYKDTNDILYSSRLTLYGKWKVTEMNGSIITPIEFSFYDDGQFRTNKQILAVAISTDATPIYYKWNGEAFITDDGRYSINLSYDLESNKLNMSCSGPTQVVNYVCSRLMTYEEMIVSENNEANTQTGEETLNQRFRTLIQDYVDKKTDNIVFKDGENINIFEGKVD